MCKAGPYRLCLAYLSYCFATDPLFSIATADSSIAIFDAKYAYKVWRPMTAIRNADLDGNNATDRDPTMVRSQPPLADKPVHGNQTLAAGIDCEKKTFEGYGAEQWRTVGRDEAWCCDFSAVQS